MAQFFQTVVLCLLVFAASSVLVMAKTKPEAEGAVIGRLQVIDRAPTVFPETARRLRLSGNVVVRVIVNPDGTVRDAWALTGDLRLQGAALQSVRLWRFESGPQPVSTLVEFHFKYTA
ncbi:MAG: energy transducer TonB [Blastocatellia bacterium]|nr:energy transducer TonB [Blastocatellia bacterium]